MLTEAEIRQRLTTLRTERAAQMESEFKRRKEEADELEERGQEYTRQLTEILKRQKIEVEAIQAISVPSKEPLEERVAKTRERMKTLARHPANEAPSVLDSISIPSVIATLTPYYTHVYDYGGGDGWLDLPWEGEDFSDYYSGPVGVMWWVKGGGTGNFGTGGSRMTGLVDRWFFFNPSVTRHYSFTVYEPYFGFYIVEAHDGDLTSKRASVSISTKIQAYQFNWLSAKDYAIFSRSGRNINESERLDMTRTFYYSELLGGGDGTFLLVSQVFVVYARGRYSYAEVNFSKGSANYLPAPYVHVY